MKYSFGVFCDDYDKITISSNERDRWGETPLFKLKLYFSEWAGCCANTVINTIMLNGYSQNDSMEFSKLFNIFNREVLQDETNRKSFFEALHSFNLKTFLKKFGYSRGIYYTLCDKKTLKPFNSFFTELLNESLKTDFQVVCSTRSQHGQYRINTYFSEL